MYQKTVKRAFSFAGMGVHSGITSRVSVEGAACNTGFTFVRSDVWPSVEIKASVENIAQTSGATVLRRHHAHVQTVEHLLAALWGSGIDNARITINGPELPILDGSAQFFVKCVEKAGKTDQGALRQTMPIHAPTVLRQNKSLAVITPAKRMSFACFCRIGPRLEFARFHWNAEQFSNDIAPARTFVEQDHITAMQAKGLLKGAPASCGILLKQGIALNTAFRMRNECAHHKLLDAIGDFALLGKYVLGTIALYNTNHTFNRFILERLMRHAS